MVFVTEMLILAAATGVGESIGMAAITSAMMARTGTRRIFLVARPGDTSCMVCTSSSPIGDRLMTACVRLAIERTKNGA